MNQDDVQERSHQVRIMGSIYSNAQGVIVWLGPVGHTEFYTKAILGAMQFHFGDGNLVAITLFDYMCSLISLLNEQAALSRDPKECVLDALFQIVDRPWFHRVWVVQELALSKIATVRIGSYSFPWQPFEYYMKWLPQHKVDPRTHPDILEAVTRVTRAPCDEHFSSQICRTVHLSATNPRDKIFSLLGISGFSTKSIEPDYTKSLQTVFQEAMAALLRDGKLGIYYYAPLHPLRGGNDPKPLPTLPSWVPDLRITGAAYALNMPCPELESYMTPNPDVAYHRPMNNLRGTTTPTRYAESFLDGMCQQLPFPPARVSTDLARLFAPGVLIGTIIETSGNLLDQLELGEVNSDSGLPQNLHSIHDSFCKRLGSDLDALKFVGRLLAPWKYVFLEEKNICRAATELFNPKLNQTNVSMGVRRVMRRLCSDIVANVRNRTLFLMDNGGTGLSYHPDSINGIRPGDLVVGLFGTNFPFILRPNEDNSYRMINVAGVSCWWGHQFLGNHEQGAWFWQSDNIGSRNHGWRAGPRRYDTNVSCEDYEQYGMKEYVIV
jgi:hypothetical protein